MIVSLFYGNTISVDLDELHDPNSSPLEYLDSSATVTATVLDSEGDPVSGGSCTLNYISGSDGHFIGYLSSSAAITPNIRYTLLISATDGGGKVGRWDIPAICEYREGDSV